MQLRAKFIFIEGLFCYKTTLATLNASSYERIMKARITSQDVANLAGVSRSAVSRFYSGGHVSEGYKKRIMKAGKQLEYRPNAIARSMTGLGTNMIAIILIDFGMTSQLKIIEEKLMLALSEHGKQILMIPVTGKSDLEESTLNALDYQVEAVIVMGGNIPSSTVKRLQTLKVPLLQYASTEGGDGVECYSCDNKKGGQMAGNFLIRAGHQRIAYLARIDDTPANRMRKAGLLSALEANGMKLHVEERAISNFDGGKTAGIRFFSMAELPDAIFCFNDIMALGVLEAAQMIKLDIPKDVSVIGYDDLPMSSWKKFDLTTLRSDLDYLIGKIVESILRNDERESKNSPFVCLAAPELIIRSTTR